MARLNSFYLPPDLWREPFELAGDEARHFSRVLRGAPGEVVRLFDGQGRAGLFRVARCAKERAWLEPLDTTAVGFAGPLPRPPGPVLAVGWNKSARRSYLLEKAVELGASGVCFWQAARSQGKVPALPKESWRGPLIAAAKQCGAAWLPELATEPKGVGGLIASFADAPWRVLLSEPPEEAASLAEPLDASRLCSESGVLVLGPEGGFDAAEAEALAKAGFAPASLGAGVLRLETAAVVALGLLFWARQAYGAGL